MKLISVVTIRTPDQTVTFKDVASVSVITEKGPMVVYAQHASLTGKIAFSILKIVHGTTEESFMVRNGLLFINNEQNSVSVLAYTLDRISEVSTETIEAYLARVKELLETGQTLLPIQYKYLENERLTLVEQLKVIGKKN